MGTKDVRREEAPLPFREQMGTSLGVALQGLALCLTFAPHGGPE